MRLKRISLEPDIRFNHRPSEEIRSRIRVLGSGDPDTRERQRALARQGRLEKTIEKAEAEAESRFETAPRWLM